jgi:hypothetical protein
MIISGTLHIGVNRKLLSIMLLTCSVENYMDEVKASTSYKERLALL